MEGSHLEGLLMMETFRVCVAGLVTLWRWESQKSGWRCACEGWEGGLGDIFLALLGHQVLP